MSTDPLSEGAVFDVAREIPSDEARSRYLDQACGDDDVLRARVLQLLEGDKPDSFLEESPVSVQPTVDTPEPTDQEGQTIGPYKLLQQIGEGGFGVVYMAEQHRPVRRKVALKVIKPGMDTKEVIGRFEAERQALAMMDHPNIARVLDAGTTDYDRPFFVMELVRGIPITEYCDRERLDTRQRLELFAKVCHAVQHAHQKGIIHRDIKPSNVLITEHDAAPVPKVIDFGVAKAINQQLTERTIFTRFQQMVGTPMYMSPEQAELSGLDVDTRADIYSLGVLLYELLTGTTPFDKQRFSEAAYDEIRRMIREEEPPKPSTRISTLGDSSGPVCGARKTDPKKLRNLVRGELDWIVMKALDKERARRYETAQGFANDIQRYLNNEAVQACPPSAMYRMRKFTRRHRGPVAAALALLALLSAGVAGTATGWINAVHARRQADERAWEAAVLRQEEETQRLLAQEKTRELEQQLRISAARGLAAQAQAIENERPVTGMLLAIEAVDATRQHDETIVPVAHETLLSSTSGMGGLPLVGHGTGRLRSGAISQDGRWLVTGGEDDSALLWDLDAEDVAASPLRLPHESAVWSVAVSFDGQWLMTRSSGDIGRLWSFVGEDRSSPRPISPTSEHSVSSLAVSPDRHWLVCGGFDGTVGLWDLHSANPTASPLELPGHGASSVSVKAVSADGRWLVTQSSESKDARLWDLTSLPISSVDLVGHEDKINKVAITPDCVVTTSADRTTRLWNLGEPDSEPVVLGGHAQPIVALAVSPDGRWLATGSGDRTARLWDLKADDPALSSKILRGHDDEVYSITITADWVITGSRDATARLWDPAADDPSVSSIVLRGHEETIQEVLIGGPRDNQLVTVSWDGMARVWDIESLNPSSPLVFHSYENTDATGAVISADSRKLITQSGDDTLQLWDLSHVGDTPVPSRIVLPSQEARVTAVAISPDSRSLITGDASGMARLFDLINSSASFRRAFPGDGGSILSVARSPDNRWLVTRSLDGSVRLWDLDDSGAAQHYEVPGYRASIRKWGTPMAISRDSHWLVTAGNDSTARLWDLKVPDPAATSRLLPGNGSNWVHSIAISPNSQWLVTTSYAGTARLWDLSRENPAESLRVLDHNEGLGQNFIRGVLSAAISADSRWLVTGRADGAVWRWDLDASDPGSTGVKLTSHTEAVLSVAIGPEEPYQVVTASEDSTACVWELTADDPAASLLILRGHAATVDAVAISPDSRWVVTTSADSTLRLWDLDIDSLIERARRLAGRELTSEEKMRFAVPAQ